MALSDIAKTVVIGVTGCITTAVLTGKASMKSAEVIAEHTAMIKDPIGNLSRELTMTPREMMQFTWKFYIPAVTVGCLTIAAVAVSQTRHAKSPKDTIIDGAL